MGDGLSVRGGRGGVTADLVDLRRTADELDRSGDVLRSLAERVGRLATSGDLLASAALSPGSAAAAGALLADAAFGPSGLLPQGLAVEAAARGLRFVAEAFETRDEAVAAWTDAREAAGGYLLGRAALPLTGAGVGVALLAFQAHLAEESATVGWDVLGGLVRGELSVDEALDQLRHVPAGAAEDLGQDALGALNALLMAHPELTDTLAGGGPGLTRGLLDGVLPGLSAVELLGVPLPDTFEEVTAGIIDLGGLAGGFDDSRPVTIGPSEVVRGTVPTGIGEIFLGQAELSHRVAPDPTRSAVRIVEVATPDGGTAYVVQIPGTQEWGLTAGSDPSDLTTNLTLEAHHDAALLDGVAAAMRQAGIGPEDPVMLTGHSQGGIAAAAFAASSEHAGDFAITHVVTGGSPIARIPIPASVQVLSLEHLQDPVPRLEGDPNPDRPNHTTVLRDLDGIATSPVGAHASDHYADTGDLVMTSDDPSIVAFRESSAHFLTGEGVVTEVSLQRSDP